jgi:hypothetical protein
MPALSDDREGVGGATMTVGGTMTGGGATMTGGGGGGGARWAWAEVGANAMVSAKAIAMPAVSPCASRWPAPVLPKYGGLDEPRINIIPKKSAAKKYRNRGRPPPICAQFFRSVNRSCLPPPADWPALLFRGHRWSAGHPGQPADFYNRVTSLLRREFHVAISGTIGFRPFDCAFRD